MYHTCRYEQKTLSDRHKFRLQATIDHHRLSMYFDHYTTSVNCCENTLYCNDEQITEYEMIDTKSFSMAYIHIYLFINCLCNEFCTRTSRMGVESLPWRWHILSTILLTGRGISDETCVLDDVFPPDDLSSGLGTQFLLIYIIGVYECILNL